MPVQRMAAGARVEARSAKVLVMGQEVVVAPTAPAAPRVGTFPERARRWGVVLAGGDGNRLRKLTRFICGDDRPKQFCPLVANQTLLEQTRIRAEQIIPSQQILFPLTRSHRAFYLQEQGIRPSQRVIQPANKGTAPPIVYSLLSIEQQDEDAIVAILPCDHHYPDERVFAAALEASFDIAARRSGSVVLLGAPPQGPETEYGWIELGPSADCADGASFHVQGFVEKPSSHIARQLLERGSLWNTFVMVGHVRGFLKMVNTALNGLVEALRKSRLWAGSEAHLDDSLYEHIQSADFSRQVLTVQPQRLIALRLASGGWSDLGHSERVTAALRAAGVEPWWMTEWQALRRHAAVAALLVNPAVA
jgi:mannose-1-phosphate guanylyltransferase